MVHGKYKTLFENAHALAVHLRDEENGPIIDNTETWSTGWLDVDLDCEDVDLKIATWHPTASGELVSLPDLAKRHSMADALCGPEFVLLVSVLDKFRDDSSSRSLQIMELAKVEFVQSIEAYSDYLGLGAIVAGVGDKLEGHEDEDDLRQLVEAYIREVENEGYWIDNIFEIDSAIDQLMDVVEDVRDLVA